MTKEEVNDLTLQETEEALAACRTYTCSLGSFTELTVAALLAGRLCEHREGLEPSGLTDLPADHDYKELERCIEAIDISLTDKQRAALTDIFESAYWFQNTLRGRTMQRVIIESPYAGEIDKNTAYARRCMRDSLDRGEAPFASHLL